jgi:transcriptional regulator with XRE-family HTH domain
MGRKKKEFNSDGLFQVRFRDLYNKKNTTQKELSIALCVSRPTIAGWLLGRNLPDIDALAKLAQYFQVSADYLLGLSDKVSPDVNFRAAAEYTGLSEDAVEWLHIGLDDFVCDGEGISDTAKKQNLKTASILIRDRSFTQMIHHLQKISLEAYLERILWILDSEYSECGSDEDDPEFRYAKKADRDVVVANLIHVLQEKRPWEKEKAVQYVMGLDNDDKLVVMEDGRNYSDDQLEALLEFQERFFKHIIIR